jgi:hypothetical protein
MSKSKIFKNVNYLGWIVIVLAFLFFYFSYFFIYIPKNEAQLKQKGFRILNEYGSNIHDKYKYFETHFGNYGVFYSIRFLENSNSIKKSEHPELDSQKANSINDFVTGLPSYVITEKKTSDLLYSYDKNGKALYLNFENKINDDDLVKSIEELYSSLTTDSLISDILKKDFSHKLPIGEFMQNLKFDELFDNIILFDESKVYYNSKPTNLTDITNPKALCDSTDKKQSGVYISLNVSGKDKHGMILPIDLAGEKFYIAGFLSDVDYQNKTRTINKQFLIFIAAILMLVFASMPILKIFFIDDRERLKARDATNSALSLIFGIGLFVLLIIGFSKKQVVDATIQHRRIHAISDTLCANVTRDIESIKSLGKAILKTGESGDTTLANKVKDAFASSVAFTQYSDLKSPFPLNEIILIDNEGIVKKGYTRTPFPAIVDVNLKERKYFSNIKTIENSWPTSDGLNFYIESIKSFNTTNYETAISFRTADPKLPVLAITSKIPSLYDQVLPGDIEFVVINRTGRVLYHSLQEKNLHENFVLECESDLKLIDAIRLQTKDETIVNYNEKKWLARIIPIKDTPFYHITLLDLNQADNKNARVFLITFYLLIASLILMIIGLLIIRWIAHSQNDRHKHIWFLNWLVLKPRKYLIYKRLSVIFYVLITFQLLGFLFAVNPVTQFIYQLIFLTFTLFLSMVFLNITDSEKIETAWFKFFNEFLVLLATVFLIVVFAFVSDLNIKQIIPLGVLFGILMFNYKYFKTENLQKLINKKTNDVPELKVKRTYLIFLFLFLTSISGVPIMRYYYSIKNFEEKHWHREQLIKVAKDNIYLQSDANYEKSEAVWFKKVQGNGLDNLELTYPDNIKDFSISSIQNTPDTSFAKQVYDLLPDPISSWYITPKLSSKNEYVVSRFRNDTLYFKKGEKTGVVKIMQSESKKLFSIINYAILIPFVLLIICISTWYLLRFLAKVLLNLNQEIPDIPDDTWLRILEQENKKRILLNSFDGEVYRQKSKEYFNSLHEGDDVMKIVQVAEIIEPDFQSETVLKASSKTIWICGFNHIVNEIDKHEKVLSFLIKLNQCNTFRIIVDLSFDIDLINEFYDDYIAENELKPEQLTQLFLLRKKWDNLFDGYLEYNGYINQKKLSKSEQIRDEDKYLIEKTGTDLDLQYSKIWANLTSYEKIVLFDLADDGLLNRKNKTMIQKLIDKRLIVTDPEPAFYAEEFCNFVRKSMKTKEVKTIENKLGLKGSWHSAKYLILLILVPLAAFVIISQGISIEKVFGIFAGGLAIITGIIRLFDSNTFKSS